MSSEGLVCETEKAKRLTTQSVQTMQNNNIQYAFYAEKNNGTFVRDDKTMSLGPTFICQRLHVFDLRDKDIENERWCQQCHQTPRKRRKSSFCVSYNGAKDMIDVNCESGHAYQLHINDLKRFKNCPRCSPEKKGSPCIADKAKVDHEDIVDKQLKVYETAFINSYKRLIEAFPLIRKFPTTNLVAIYFNNELYNLSDDHQPSCMAVHLILEHKSFVKAIFDKLNDQLRRKFFYKIVAGISPLFSTEPKTLEAYEYIHSLTLA